MLNNEKAREIANLLDEDFSKCKVQIVRSKATFVLLKVYELFNSCFSFKHIKGVLQGKVAGTYNSDLKTVQVYLFNMKRFTSSRPVFTLLHELRHYYQDANNLLNEKDIEYDCDTYAENTLIKYQKQINMILNK